MVIAKTKIHIYMHIQAHTRVDLQIFNLTITGSELGAQVVLRGELGLLLGVQGSGATWKAGSTSDTEIHNTVSHIRLHVLHYGLRL